MTVWLRRHHEAVWLPRWDFTGVELWQRFHVQNQNNTHGKIIIGVLLCFVLMTGLRLHTNLYFSTVRVNVPVIGWPRKPVADW